MQSLTSLEQSLARLLGRKHAVVTGRGASAIYLALRSLGMTKGRVLMPAACCPSPANSILYAGLTPLFGDVTLEDFNLAPSSIEKLLKRHSDVVAIMPVHLYGQAAPMNAIREIAQTRGIPVIEDAAQSLGGTYFNEPLGSFGDISIVSFGHTKTIDIGWGGAALTDNDQYAFNLRKHLADLPACPANIDELYAEYRKAYYVLKPMADQHHRLNALFTPLPDIFRSMHLFQLPEKRAADIEGALSEISSKVVARRERALLYRSKLEPLGVQFSRYDANAAPWRCSFRVNREKRDAVVSHLRAAGLDASTWYPALPAWYESGRQQPIDDYANASRLASEVVNLWVDPGTSHERVSRACECIHEFTRSGGSITPINS